LSAAMMLSEVGALPMLIPALFQCFAALDVSSDPQRPHRR
jgi:hypothetical protein